MKKLLFFILVLILLIPLLLIGCSSPPDDKVAINQTLDQYQAALQNKDVDKIVSLTSIPYKITITSYDQTQNLVTTTLHSFDDETSLRTYLKDQFPYNWLLPMISFELKNRQININGSTAIVNTDYYYKTNGSGVPIIEQTISYTYTLVNNAGWKVSQESKQN